MEKIYPIIVDCFDQNRISVLATIIQQEGSAPRGVGTKCLILNDGRIIGTIGGGQLEATVVEESRKVVADRSPARFRFSLEGATTDAPDMICGGDVEIFLEPLDPENIQQRDIFEKILELDRRGGSGLLATVIDPERWSSSRVPKALLEPNGQIKGTLPENNATLEQLRPKMDQLLRQGQPLIITGQDRHGDPFEIFLEPLLSDPRLYVFGGGHVSLELVPLAARVGFKVAVIDDRREYADHKKFPEAGEVHNFLFEGVLDRLPVDESAYLVIVTRGHAYDKTVLEQALKTPAKYIGMIGSRRKIRVIYDQLGKEGFTDKDLERVHSPIGLEIGAQTPQEIAVSIVAELIKVRAGQGARHKA